MNSTSTILGYGEATKENCAELDEFFNYMKSNYSMATDYLRLICKRDFERNLSTKYNHLEIFYMFVPCLTLTFIRNQVKAKERITKKNFKGGSVSDDGFILGVYYMLEILNQGNAFESIHWFEEVTEKVTEELDGMKHELAKAKEMMKKNFESYQEQEIIETTMYYNIRTADLKEFTLLQANAKSCRLLFKKIEDKTKEMFYTDDKKTE